MLITVPLARCSIESDPSNGDRMMGFAGMERDTVTGMNLAVNRVQNPGTGRWTSQDPLGFAAGDADLYRYVLNGPTSQGDPFGLAPPKKKARPPTGVGTFPSPTPIGVPPTLGQVLATPCMQRLMRQLHLAHTKDVKEQGRFVLSQPHHRAGLGDDDWDWGNKPLRHPVGDSSDSWMDSCR